MSELERVSKVASETLGGEPRTVAQGLLRDFEARLGHRPTPEEVAVLLAAIDEARGCVKRYAAPEPACDGEKRERCPGSDQMLLSTAVRGEHKCPDCGARVGERKANGRRTLEEHDRPAAAPPWAGTTVGGGSPERRTKRAR